MNTTTKAAKDLRKGDVVIVNGAEVEVYYDSQPSLPYDGLNCVYLKGLLTNDAGIFVLDHMEFTVKALSPEERFRAELPIGWFELSKDIAVKAARAAGLL